MNRRWVRGGGALVLGMLFAALGGATGCAAGVVRPAAAARVAPARRVGPESYVIVRDGGALSLLPQGATEGGHLWNGRGNCPHGGYAVGAEPDGGLLVVRYGRRDDGGTQYSIRHVRPTGEVDWTQRVDVPSRGPGREVVVAAAPSRRWPPK